MEALLGSDRFRGETISARKPFPLASDKSQGPLGPSTSQPSISQEGATASGLQASGLGTLPAEKIPNEGCGKRRTKGDREDGRKRQIKIGQEKGAEKAKVKNKDRPVIPTTARKNAAIRSGGERNATAGPSRAPPPRAVIPSPPSLDLCADISSPMSERYRSPSIATAKTESQSSLVSPPTRKPGGKNGRTRKGRAGKKAKALDQFADEFFTEMEKAREVERRKEEGEIKRTEQTLNAAMALEEEEDSMTRLLESLERHDKASKWYDKALEDAVVLESYPSEDPDGVDHEDRTLSAPLLRDSKEASELTICAFCSGDLPDPSTVEEEFIDLKCALWKLSRPPKKPRYPFSRDLDLLRRLDFCHWHEALTRTIPSGLAAGYPASIDFLAIPRRLEKPWIRREIARLAKYPVRSKKYLECVKYIDEFGLQRWRQAQVRELTFAQGMHAGYYGVPGREIIADHIRHLVDWGYLPELVDYVGFSPDCDPLTTDEYIDHVMVPAAAVLLILEDQGATLEGVSEADAGAVKEPAELVWRESREFGQWQYRDCSASRRIHKESRRQVEEVKEMVRAGRGRSGKGATGANVRTIKGRKKANSPSRDAHPICIVSSDEDDVRPGPAPESQEPQRKSSIKPRQLKPTDSMATLADAEDRRSPPPALIPSQHSRHGTLAEGKRVRSFAHTDSFDSGFGTDAYDGLDFAQIDEQVSAKLHRRA